MCFGLIHIRKELLFRCLDFVLQGWSMLLYVCIMDRGVVLVTYNKVFR